MSTRDTNRPGDRSRHIHQVAPKSPADRPSADSSQPGETSRRRDSTVHASPESGPPRRVPLALLIASGQASLVEGLKQAVKRCYTDPIVFRQAEVGGPADVANRRGDVDLVLVDESLLNGELAGWFTSTDGRPTAMVAVLGREDEESAAAAIALGARDYLPINQLGEASFDRALGRLLRSAQMAKLNQDMSRQLERSHREIDYLVRALSHDMNANFMVLESSFRQLKRNCPRESVGDLVTQFAHVDACLAESKRFVNDLVALGQTGAVEMEAEPVDLALVVSEVLFEQKYVLAERGIRVEVDEHLPRAWCNPGRAKQVFTNLLRNAARHGCDPARPRITIEHTSPPSWAGEVSRADDVWVRVYDNGPGIPPTARETIFEPGKRLPGGHPEGSGMGLTIVKKIIEHFGGTVAVDADCKDGTAIVFSLTFGGDDGAPSETLRPSPATAHLGGPNLRQHAKRQAMH